MIGMGSIFTLSFGKVKASMQSGQGFSLDSIRKATEEKILAAVDGVVNRIPNGQEYKDQFRQAISGAMDDLQRQAQSQLSNMSGMLGNMGDRVSRKHDQGGPPVH